MASLIPPPPSFNYPLPKDSQERADELCKRGRAWMDDETALAIRLAHDETHFLP